MTRSQATAARFREVILDGTWVANTNFKAQLSGMGWEAAVVNFGTLNSVAALAQHIHYYIAGVKNVFEGGTLDIRDQFSFDFKPIGSQQEWDAFLERFWNDAEQFATLVEKMTEGQLDAVFTKAKYGTYQRNIDGMIEHSYYHLGQIVLLKKLLEMPLQTKQF